MDKMIKTEKLAGQTLYKLAHASETAENVCLALGMRERIRDFSNLSSLKYELRHQGFKIVESDYMKMWKDWQDAGLGMIEFGRDKKQTKFVHFYDMRKIAAAAIEGKDVEVAARKKEEKAADNVSRSLNLDRIAKSVGEAVAKASQSAAVTKELKKIENNAKKQNAPEVATQTPKVERRANPGINRIIISLRPNAVVDFTLPQDITPDEIDRIREALNRVAPAGAYSAA